jgi:hypothetical protein
MSTAFCSYLVLNVTSGGAELDKRLDCPGNVECPAESRVNVNKQRQITNVGDTPYIGENIVDS